MAHHRHHRALADISGRYSYALRVPFETLVRKRYTLSPNALALNSTAASKRDNRAELHTSEFG